MTEICPKCGLPQDLCVCETIAKEEQTIHVRKEKKRYGKIVTLVEGIDPSTIDMKEVAKTLKNKLACGGTIKNAVIELQGDHVAKAKQELIKLGFHAEAIQ